MSSRIYPSSNIDSKYKMLIGTIKPDKIPSMNTNELKIGDRVKYKFWNNECIGIITKLVNYGFEIDNINGGLHSIVQYTDIISKLEPVYKEILVTLPNPPLKCELGIQVADVIIDYRRDCGKFHNMMDLTTTRVIGFNSNGIRTELLLPSVLNFKCGKSYKITIEEVKI